MVFHGVVYYPGITTHIESFRKQYDPTYNLIRAHVALVFPVDLAFKPLSEHIQSVLNQWDPFHIVFSGFKKSWDHWLFLYVKKGNQKMRLLHDELYTSILQPYLRTDIEYIPHIGLGHFIKENEKYDYQNPTQCDLDEARYKKALEKAKNLDISYSATVEKVNIVKIDDRFTYTKDVKQFFLGSY